MAAITATSSQLGQIVADFLELNEENQDIIRAKMFELKLKQDREDKANERCKNEILAKGKKDDSVLLKFQEEEEKEFIERVIPFGNLLCEMNETGIILISMFMYEFSKGKIGQKTEYEFSFSSKTRTRTMKEFIEEEHPGVNYNEMHAKFLKSKKELLNNRSI